MLKSTDYVRAARGLGATTSQILLEPHPAQLADAGHRPRWRLGIPAPCLPKPGSALSGLGIAPPTPSWGQMIGRYQTYIQTFCI